MFISRKYIYFIIAICFSFSRNSWASYTIKDIFVECGDSVSCQSYTDKFLKFPKKFKELGKVKDEIKYFLVANDIISFNYKIKRYKGEHYLLIDFKLRKKISEISFKYKNQIEETYVEKIISIKKDEFLNTNKLFDSVTSIKKYLKENGYNFATVNFEKIIKGEAVEILFTVDLGEPSILREVILNGANEEIRRRLNRKLKPSIDQKWSKVELGELLDEFTKELKKEGHFFIQIDRPIVTNRDKKNVNISINLSLGDKFIFSLSGNKVFQRNELMQVIYKSLEQQTSGVRKVTLENVLIEKYENVGIFNTKVDITIRPDSFSKDLKSFQYYINILEGNKIKIQKIDFKGANKISPKEIKKLLLKKAPTLYARGYYQKSFVKYFSTEIKKYYLSKGFVFVNVEEPSVRFSNNKKLADVIYKIREGLPTYVGKIVVKNVSDDILSKIYKSINNKKGKPLNVEKLRDDLTIMVETLKENGYLNARLNIEDESGIVKYSPDFSEASIEVEAIPGNKVFLENIIILGNIKTRSVVIEREINLEQNEVLTPSRILNLERTLKNLGIFSQVKVITLEDTSDTGKVNLLISVKEKDYTFIELAPGFRTDIGMKLSNTFGFENLWGMDRSFLLKSLVNQRLDYSAFDQRRQHEQKKTLEFSIKNNFSEPYLFGLPVQFQTSLSFLRKRFFSFDADIFRLITSVTKDFTRYFATSLTWQIDNISQFDATDEADDANFRVGALIPSITLDFRDNPINPLSGAFLNLSAEFANPTFLSQEETEQKVDYFKVISRNKFYIPANFGVIAISLNGGYQKNLATNKVTSKNGTITTDGFIPSIKVFRISGTDLPRGYKDNELNRVESDFGKIDISDIIVRNNAYFTNLKFEPRFFISDSSMVGVFFDAGHLFVNHWKPLDLRPSIGVSFKYLTPVGTLNFDYGFKLERERLPSGQIESPGRFRLSIGFF